MHSRTQRHFELILRLDSVGYSYGRAAIASKLSNALKSAGLSWNPRKRQLTPLSPCRFPCTTHGSLDEDPVRGDDRLEDRFPRVCWNHQQVRSLG
jgi:hypothetical protein